MFVNMQTKTKMAEVEAQANRGRGAGTGLGAAKLPKFDGTAYSAHFVYAGTEIV
jgi:hypothetical protein